VSGSISRRINDTPPRCVSDTNEPPAGVSAGVRAQHGFNPSRHLAGNVRFRDKLSAPATSALTASIPVAFRKMMMSGGWTAVRKKQCL
jgi:hypothetical protein